VARYWRISGIQTASNALALSALALSDGSTDYPTATITGALSAGFKINWDLGADISITQIKLTSTTQSDWPARFLLESSSDNASWTAAPGLVGDLVWPGPASSSTVTPGGTGTTPATIYAAHPPGDVTCISDETTPASGVVFIASNTTWIDQLDGGTGQITGTVKNTPNSPVYRRVLLVKDRDRRIVRETWSDPTSGSYTFSCISMADTYTVLAYDHTTTYRAVIADRITPDLML